MLIARSAIEAYRNRPFRDSSRAKRLSNKVLDRHLARLSPPPKFHTSPRQHQKVAFLLGVKYPRYLYFLDMGTGKALPLDEKVLTPDGFCRMGDIKPGSRVIGSDGKPTTVTGVFPQGEREVFCVRFSDGSKVESTDDHLWQTFTAVQKKRGHPGKVRPLSEVRGDLFDGAGNAKHFVPMVKPVDYGHSPKLAIHPYIVGVLLGDGGLTKGVTLSTADDFIVSKVERLLLRGHRLARYGEMDFAVVAEERGQQNHVLYWFRTYGLIGKKSADKFIPSHFLTAQIEDRLELLRGLLDTDGSACRKGMVQFYSKSPRLALEVRQLVQSLGGLARMTEKVVKGSFYYTLQINLPEGMLGFSLPRKVARCKAERKYFPARAIVSVDSVGIKPCQCIAVQAKDGLFLTRDFVVTHNTWVAMNLFKYARGSTPLRMLVLVPGSSNVGQWVNEVSVHAPDLTVAGVEVSGEENRRALVRGPSDIVVLTYAGFLALVSRPKIVRGKTRGWDIDPKKLREFCRLFKFVCFDECFVTGTPVDTPWGPRSIESLQVGDPVYNRVGVGRVARVWKKKAYRLIEVRTSVGIFHCSEGHPFWVVGQGWTPASELRKGDPLEDRKTVRRVWSGVSNLSGFRQDSSVLQSSLRLPKSGAEGSGFKILESCLGPSFTRTTIGDESGEEQNARSRRSGQIESDAAEDWSSPTSSRWKWSINKTTEATLVGAGARRVEGRAWGGYSSVGAGVPTMLQSRFGASESQGSCGGGRTKPPQSEKHGEGSEEGGQVDGAWVEGVSVVECGDFGGRFQSEEEGSCVLWDIEVTGDPSFYVGGVLVHNCTAFRNPKGLTYRACRKLSWEADYAYGLTGTPFGTDKNALDALWTQFHVVDQGETLGKTLGLARAVFCTEHHNRWSGWPEYRFDKRKKGELRRMIRHRSVRYRITECADLPPRNEVVREVQFAPETWQYYDRLLAELVDAKGVVRLVESAFLRMRQLTAGYLALKVDPGEEDAVEQADQIIRFKHNPKLDALIDDLSAMPLGAKAVVFHEYRLTGQTICERLRKEKITHRWLWSGAGRKSKLVDEFLTDPKVKVLVSSSAGAYGGNWQRANYFMFFEPPTDPILRQQEERRGWRMGQTRPVCFYDYVMRGSVDARILASLRAGRNLLRDVVEGEVAPRILRRRPQPNR